MVKAVVCLEDAARFLAAASPAQALPFISAAAELLADLPEEAAFSCHSLAGPLDSLRARARTVNALIQNGTRIAGELAELAQPSGASYAASGTAVRRTARGTLIAEG